MKDWVLVVVPLAFIAVLVIGVSIGLVSKTGTASSSTAVNTEKQALSSSSLSSTDPISMTGVIQSGAEERVDSSTANSIVLNVAINWVFSDHFNVIDACNVITDRDLPNGTLVFCELTGHDDNPFDGISNIGPVVGSGEMMSDSDRTVTVPVLCDPTGDMNFTDKCDIQDIAGVQIIFIRTIVIQVCTEFRTGGTPIQGSELSCYDIPRTTQVDFRGDALLQFTHNGSPIVDDGTAISPVRSGGFTSTGLIISWDEFTGEITGAEWIRTRGNDVVMVPILVPEAANDLHLSISGPSARIDNVHYAYSVEEEADPIMLDAPSNGNERPNDVRFTIQEKNIT
jgi:hypothetical protein